MKIERLVDVCPAFAEALGDYDLARLRDADGEELDILWQRVVYTAAVFRDGMAVACNDDTIPLIVPHR